MSRSRVLSAPVATLASVLVLAPSLAVSPASAQRDLFYDTVDVRVVNLEVVVTDEDGAPVRGLERDDFELLVDGRPVEIANFFAVEAGAPVLPAAAEARGPAPGLDAADPAPGPVTRRLDLVVFVDDVHASAQGRNAILRQLRDHLARVLEPGDRVLLARLDERLEVVQPLTGDLPKIFAALERLQGLSGRNQSLEADYRRFVRNMAMTRLGVSGRYGTVPRGNRSDADLTELAANSEASQIETLARDRHDLGRAAIAALRQFVDTLAGLEGRKAMIYVSDGVTASPGEALVQAWREKYEAWIVAERRGDLQDVMNQLVDLDLQLRAELDDLNTYAAAHRVAIYPVTSGARLIPASGPANTSGSFYDDGRGPDSRTVTAIERFNTENTLLRMAGETGGRATTHSPELGKLLAGVKQDFETFYSLGYAPEHESDGPVDVEVRVRRPGVTVRHARSVEDRDPLDRLQDLALSALYHGIEDNPLEVRLDPGEPEPVAEGRFRVPVMVKIPFSKLLLLPQEAQHAGRVTLFVVVRDEDSRGLSPFHHVELPLRVPNDQLVQVMAQTAAYPLQLDMEPGRKRLSVGVRDHLSRTDATVTLEVEVGAGAASAAAEDDTPAASAEGR